MYFRAITFESPDRATVALVFLGHESRYMLTDEKLDALFARWWEGAVPEDSEEAENMLEAFVRYLENEGWKVPYTATNELWWPKYQQTSKQEEPLSSFILRNLLIDMKFSNDSLGSSETQEFAEQVMSAWQRAQDVLTRGRDGAPGHWE